MCCKIESMLTVAPLSEMPWVILVDSMTLTDSPVVVLSTANGILVLDMYFQNCASSLFVVVRVPTDEGSVVQVPLFRLLLSAEPVGGKLECCCSLSSQLGPGVDGRWP